MSTIETLLTVSETVYFLARGLGPAQNWADVLNDFRQERRDFGCPPLLPVAIARRGSRKGLPVYRPSDVQEFIQAVRELRGCNTPYPLQPQRFKRVECNPGSSWTGRKIEPLPSPP